MQDEQQPIAMGDDFFRRFLDVMRLHEMARNAGINTSGERGWGFELALKLAQEKFPGFSRPSQPKKTLGRKVEKGPHYRLCLATVVALHEQRGSKRGVWAKLARGMAEHYVTAKASKAGRRPNQVDIDKEARLNANDISNLTLEERFIGWCVAGLSREGLGFDEITQTMTTAAESGHLAYMFAEFSAERSHKK